MTDKITSKVLVAALRNKYAAKQAAVLTEVTMEDPVEAELAYAYYVQSSSYARKQHQVSGKPDPTVTLPTDYNYNDRIFNRRIDALIFEGNERTAVEIKVSRADFFRDTDEKRGVWKNHTDRFVYLTPKGLMKVEEIPDGCALWEYDGHKITVIKRAKLNKDVQEFPQSMVKYFAWRSFIAERKNARYSNR